jgi:hypothetical protein
VNTEECAFQLLVTDNVVLSSQILVSLNMEAIRSPKRRFLQEPHKHDIPEDDILHSHSCENLRSYTALTGWAL